MTTSGSEDGKPTQSGWRDPLYGAIVALGITQIVSWGTTLYALGVLAAPIAADTGWSRSLAFGGLTIGLLCSGLVSTPVGRLTDSRGGRLVMSIGSVWVAAGLLLLALVGSEIQYLAAWALLGPAMRMTLYDAAFASLVQVDPARGRRAISYLTLFGGFASSVFWPIGHALAAAIGWRNTCLVYALLNIGVCLPLHWWGLARRVAALPVTQSHTAGAGAAISPVLEGAARTLAIVMFALATSASAFVFGAMAVHLPSVLQAHGLTAATAVTLASIKGVAQVGGRICEIVWGKNMHALDLGRLSIGMMPLAFVVLMLGGASFAAALAFTVLFGIANGLVTIVRGAVPLVLFGQQGYGAILGILATPYLVLNALAPLAYSMLVEAFGTMAGEALVLGAGIAAALAMEAMALWYRRRKSA